MAIWAIWAFMSFKKRVLNSDERKAKGPRGLTSSASLQYLFRGYSRYGDIVLEKLYLCFVGRKLKSEVESRGGFPQSNHFLAKHVVGFQFAEVFVEALLSARISPETREKLGALSSSPQDFLGTLSLSHDSCWGSSPTIEYRKSN